MILRRNPHFSALQESYLFPQIQARKAGYLRDVPDADLIDLGIGDTRLPIPGCAARGMSARAVALASATGYSGYGDERGELPLRSRIAQEIYRGELSPDEIFIGDGSKCDLARLQVFLGPGARIGMQDPTYPAYRDGALLTHGALGADDAGERIHLIPCMHETGHFPDIARIDPNIDALIFCSPNNPTGYAASRAQLQELVDWALETRTLLAFDAAYSWYVRDEAIPKSIFEIRGAQRCAIEFNSFSKMAGFTGVRLSWVALSNELKSSAGDPLIKDWRRLAQTLFNGASNLAQAGGLACLTPEGLEEIRALTDAYLNNAGELRQALSDLEISSVGGENAPYLWAHFPGLTSWEAFELLLDRCQLVTTPGSGFGRSGEGYLRFSGFAHSEDAKRAAQRLRANPLLQRAHALAKTKR